MAYTEHTRYLSKMKHTVALLFLIFSVKTSTAAIGTAPIVAVNDPSTIILKEYILNFEAGTNLTEIAQELNVKREVEHFYKNSPNSLMSNP